MPPAIPDKLPCTNAAQLEHELNDIRQVITQPETEDNWEKIARSLQKYAAIVRGGAAKVEPEFGKALRELSRPINAAMCSERSRLSGTACDLLGTIAPRLGEKFEPFLILFMPELLKLCTRTNKLFIARAQKTIALFITHTKLASIIPYLREAVKDKSATLRVSAIEAALRCMREYEHRTLQAKVEDIESIVASTATDSNPEVRKLSKQLFELYKQQFPDRVDSFSDPLTPITKRYLDVLPRDKNAALSRSQLSRSTTSAPPPARPQHRLAASTSNLPTVERKPAARSVSATVVATSSRAKQDAPVAGPSSAPAAPVRSAVTSGSVERPSTTESVGTASQPHERPPSILRTTSARPRPASAQARAPPFRPKRVPSDSTQSASATATASKGFMRPTASSRSATAGRLPASAVVRPASAAATATSRPPLARLPTAPAALLSNAARRPLPLQASKASSARGGKVLGGGAKRVVAARPANAPTAAVLAQAIRKTAPEPRQHSHRDAEPAREKATSPSDAAAAEPEKATTPSDVAAAPGKDTALTDVPAATEQVARSQSPPTALEQAAVPLEAAAALEVVPCQS